MKYILYLVHDTIRSMYCGIQKKLKGILSTYGYRCLITFTQLYLLNFSITSQIYRMEYTCENTQKVRTRHAIALG